MRRAPLFSWVGKLALASSFSIGLVACSGGGSSTTSTPATPPTVGITKIVMDTANSQKATFGGTTFGTNGSVGTYDKIRGTAYGVIDPADPKNQVITDIALAKKNYEFLSGKD